jgi:AcrR family transcriptional regulator
MPRAPRPDRRPQFLDAATAAIRRHGPGASMTQIAAEAGVTKPILYRHFRDRDGLVHALGQQFSADLMAELQTSLQAGNDPRQLLVGTIDTYIAFIERDPNVYRFLVQHVSGGTGAEPDTLISFMQQVGQQVAIVVGEQMRAAGRDSGGAEPIAHGIVGMVHSAGHWWVEHRTMPRARLVEYLADLLWAGVAGLVLTESGVT